VRKKYIGWRVRIHERPERRLYPVADIGGERYVALRLNPLPGEVRAPLPRAAFLRKGYVFARRRLAERGAREWVKKWAGSYTVLAPAWDVIRVYRRVS
jgi:hypothetical protein